MSWTNFKAGPQPAEKFDIKGVDTCPQDPQCGNKVYNCKDWQVSNSTPMLDMQICKFAWIIGISELPRSIFVTKMDGWIRHI